jgi:nucleoside-diphosphate-sugar epimerase
LIAITGASGYVGAHCVGEAIKRGQRVVAISTQPASKTLARLPADARDLLSWQFVGDYHALDHAEWVARLRDTDTIIHCAARVHDASASSEAFHRDNVVLTERIASAARDAGVQRFIFLSSAAVYGDAVDLPAHSVNAPVSWASPYGKSKVDAEQKLVQAQEKNGLSVHILRPPVVYGANAPGNMLRLARWVARELPLPFGAVDNRRSIVSIRGLVAAIFWCAARPIHDGAPISIWHPTDRDAISTTAMVNAIARGLKRSSPNLRVPPALLRMMMIAAGQRRIAQQLLDSWELDSSNLSDAGFDGFADSKIELALLGRSLLRS